jgi:putative adhesin
MPRHISLLIVFVGLVHTTSRAQSAADGPVLGAKYATAGTAIRMYNQAGPGRIRVVAWDRDSLLVRGRVPKGNFFLGGGPQGVKLGLEARWSSPAPEPSEFSVYVPKGSKVDIRTVSADIEAAGVSGSFYSVSGAIRLSGSATSVEAESMNGNLDLNVETPWMRARTGDGHLLLRGAPQDVDAGTIGGTLDIATQTVLRGQFSSVSGDIHYVGSPAPSGIFEFSNHSGAVDLQLPRDASGTFALSSIVGEIENGFVNVRPAASTAHSMRVTLGRGGANVTVRTFKGQIRLRPN